MKKQVAASALAFVVTIGIVNLFADATYEGGTAINGPFLGSLGASAAAISIVAGAGEFLGYALRSVSGAIADRTGRLWLLSFVGYAVNMLVVPAMALAGNWPVAAALVMAERVGRAIRKPTVETMLSYTTAELGPGRVYALNSALDETGAALGPLLTAFVVWKGGSDRTAYAVLLVPALLTLVALVAAWRLFPAPSRLERSRHTSGGSFSRRYWISSAAAACFGAGVMSFELVSYHLARTGVVGEHGIPLFLAAGTVFGIGASLVLGRLYDRFGLPVVLGAVCVSACFAPLVFLGGFGLALAGILLWGVGYATQDTLFKALVAGLMPEGRRSRAFGTFYAIYGVGWLVGSVATGLLYDRSRTALIAFVVAAQLLSIPLFLVSGRAESRAMRHA